jgi:hypothetical protein
MLEISGNLRFENGSETIDLKTNESNTLVLRFSSWEVFQRFIKAPKMLNLSLFDLRSKLKHLNTPLLIEIGESDSFILKNGTPKSISVSTVTKLARYSLFG